MSEQQANARQEPLRSRPRLPEGYLIESSEDEMLAWADVDRRLNEARVYWLSTAGADGAPHATPIWGAWVDRALYFDGDYKNTLWGRNLSANPRIAVHIDSDNFAIMFKGTPEIVDVDPATFAQVADSFAAKYSGYRPPTNEGMYRVTLSVAFAWDNENFGKTATRWRFSGA